jgi:hypothetical protein
MYALSSNMGPQWHVAFAMMHSHAFELILEGLVDTGCESP